MNVGDWYENHGFKATSDIGHFLKEDEQFDCSVVFCQQM